MEKRKAIKMLIARYRADATSLEKRKDDLTRQMEMIENLLPTVTIAYISKATQSSGMCVQRAEIEATKERLEHLKRSLKGVQQTIDMIREEEKIMYERIEELEKLLSENPQDYTDNSASNGNLVQSFDLPVISHQRKTDDLKINECQDQKVKFEESQPAWDTGSKLNLGINIDKDKSKPDKPTNLNKKLSKKSPQETVKKSEKNKVNLKDERVECEREEVKEQLQDETINLEHYSDTNFGKTKPIIKPGKSNVDQVQNLDVRGFEEKGENILKELTQDQDTVLENYSASKIGRTPIQKPDQSDFLRNSVKAGCQEQDKTYEKDVITEELVGQKMIFEELLKDENTVAEKYSDSKIGMTPILKPDLSDFQKNSDKAVFKEDDTKNEKDDITEELEGQKIIFEELLKDENTVSESYSDSKIARTRILKPDKSDFQKNSHKADFKEEDKTNEKDVITEELEGQKMIRVDLLQDKDTNSENYSDLKIGGSPPTPDQSNFQKISAKGSFKEEDITDEKDVTEVLEGKEVKFKELMRDEDTDSANHSDSKNGVTSHKLTPDQSDFRKIPEKEVFKEEDKTNENDVLTKELEGLKMKFEELLQDEHTDWKQVCETLSHRVNTLSVYLENSTKRLKDSEGYVKHLEEQCSWLEKELQRKVRLLTLTAYKMGEGEGITPAYMQLAHWRFALKLPEYQADRELKEKLFNGIKQGNMAPYYKEVCADLGWEFDSKLYDEMSAANVKRLEELEKEHENNVMDEEDQSQLCGVWQSKLDYLCSIGDSENATTLANSKVDDKTVPKSHRIDAVFSLFRISFFHGCNIKGMSTAIEKATELIEGISGGDWSARNKLKAYEGVWSLAIRDFTRAAHLFVDVVPTFESYELADFGTIIRYTVLSCMIALPRCDLRKKLMLHGVMAQALHSQYQDLREYFVSLYDGRYSDFLICLARIEVEMKRDPLLHPHYRHYVQEMRLRAYKQILQAYRSLSLDYMAQSFGVTSEFIEREVARFAAAGRLQCKIDSVAGTVITSAHLDDSVRSKEAPEASQDRNILYQTTVKRGDILLNRLKKLARVMDF